MMFKKAIPFLAITSLVILVSFQNCGNVGISGINTDNLSSLSTDCVHPAGSFPNNPEIPIQLFKDANICSNLGETCQSAYFICDNGQWRADARNAAEKIELYPYRKCLSQFCQPPTPPPDCPNPMPAFQCPSVWGPWSNSSAQCGESTRTCTRTLPLSCKEPTSNTEIRYETCPVPPPPPACPDPLPAFQCGDWGAWSKPLGVCGTRTRTCTRTLPSGCNEPATQQQVDSVDCEATPPGTISINDRCNVFSQYVPQCQPNSAINLNEIVNGAWVNVALPSSQVLSIPFDPMMSANGVVGYNRFTFSGSGYNCSAMVLELNITNRKGVIIGTRNDGSFGEIPASWITTDEAYSGASPATPNYQNCYYRGIAPQGMGGAEISYSIPSRPDDITKMNSCVIDPANGPWYLNVRYSYPIPRLLQQLGLSQMIIPIPPYCGLGLR